MVYTVAMQLDPAQWLATLRRRRREILCAVLPVIALSAVSGPACASMSGSSGTSTESHGSHDAHAVGHHSASHAHAPVAPTLPCPHCPLDSGAANASHAGCVTIDAQQDDGAAPPNSADTPVPPVFLARWLLPAARASPPSIALAIAHHIPPALAVPLTLRHCVLLI